MCDTTDRYLVCLYKEHRTPSGPSHPKNVIRMSAFQFAMVMYSILLVIDKLFQQGY